MLMTAKIASITVPADSVCCLCYKLLFDVSSLLMLPFEVLHIGKGACYFRPRVTIYLEEFIVCLITFAQTCLIVLFGFPCYLWKSRGLLTFKVLSMFSCLNNY